MNQMNDECMYSQQMSHVIHEETKYEMPAAPKLRAR